MLLQRRKARRHLYAPVISRILGELGLCLGLCTWPISAFFALRTTEACLLAARLSLWCGSPSPTSPPQLAVLCRCVHSRAPHHHHTTTTRPSTPAISIQTKLARLQSKAFQPTSSPSASRLFRPITLIYILYTRGHLFLRPLLTIVALYSRS